MEKTGWIKVYRQIMEHPFYEEERVFSRNEAWLYILLRVNYEDVKVMISGKMVDVPRGSFITSEAKLMDRFKWGKERLRNFLKLLENEGMICREAKKLYTQISVINYEKYQSNSDRNADWQKTDSDAGFPDEADYDADRKQTTDRPHADHRPATDKEIKNIRTKEENIYTIFEHWNSKKITVHRELTETTKSAVNARLKVHSLDVLLEAINNYHKCLSGEEFYYTHKFTLKDFMNPKNVDRFLTENEPFENFRNKFQNNGKGESGVDQWVKELEEERNGR